MELTNNLYSAIVKGNLPLAIEQTNVLLEQGVPAQAIITDHMSKAMETVGARFEAGQAFVPELLMAARAMKGGLNLLKPLLAASSDTQLIGTVVIGTVKGDLHDIGKNLVASMLEGCGFEVVNLGVDVSTDKFVQAVKEHKADILCLSALLTTTMDYMKDVIAALEKANLRQNIKIIIGGAPINSSFADEIKADGYSSNANSAVSLAKSMMA